MKNPYIPWKDLNPSLKKDLRSPKYKQRVVKDTHKEQTESDRYNAAIDSATD